MDTVAYKSFDDSLKSLTVKVNKLELQLQHIQNEVDKCIDITKNEIIGNIKTLSAQMTFFNQTMVAIEQRVDALERKERACDMVITGIPILKRQVKFLTKLVRKLALMMVVMQLVKFFESIQGAH